MHSSEIRVGLFALIALVIIGFITIKIGGRSFIAGGGYDVIMIVDNAIGLRPKTPVEIAGIKVGKIKKIELEDSRKAKLTLSIDGDIVLPPDSKAFVRAKGFLGEVVVEILPGYSTEEPIKDDGRIDFAGQTGDVNMLLTQFNAIATDVKAVSSSLRDMVAGDKDSPVWHIVNNLESFTKTLADNQGNFNKVSDNLAALTEALRGTIAKSKENVEESIQRISSITKKIDEGKGTIGKLVNDDTTVTKLNEAVDNLNSTLGGLRQMETEIGFHTEYLAQSSQFKQYVNLTLRPKPDKAFIFDFVTEQNPPPTYMSRDTTVTVNGASSTYQSTTATVNRNQFRISAQIAKSFYDFTIRGGIIESSGGMGMDYEKGPVGLQFSAWNFQTDFGQRPQLKMSGTVNLTTNLYLIGGAEDMIDRNNAPDWFFGGGFRLADDDIKSIFGLASGAALKK